MSVGASLAAHLVLLAALARVGGRVPERRPPRLAVELVDIPEAAAPGPRVPPPRASATVPRSPAPRPSAPRAPAGPAPPHARPLEALAEEGLSPAPHERAAPDLRPRPWKVVPPPEPGAKGSGAARGPEADAAGGADALRRWAAELAGRARVEDGLAHPYHSELASALARSWDVERAVKGHGLSGYLANVGDNLKTFGRVWAQLADGYGRTGAPSVVDGGSERFRELSGLPAGPAREVLAQAEAARQLRRAWSEGHVATVRVVQGRDGRLESVELVSPSSDPAVDREALAAVPAAIQKVPPPAEVLAGRDTLATSWEFELEVSISPPIPAVAIEFDEVLGGLDFRAPLDRRIWKRVRLVAIE